MRIPLAALWIATTVSTAAPLAAGGEPSVDAQSESPWTGPPPVLLGHFAARAESLGFDEYRHLEPDLQLERRETAKRLVRRGNEINLKGVELDPYATAVGYCPYLPEAWQRYATGLNELGEYQGALFCLAMTQRTLKYESSGRKRKEVTAAYHSLLAAVAYNTGDAQSSYDNAVRALELREDDDLKLLKARALVELGRFDEAVETLAEFDHQSSAYARSLSTLALVEMERGRFAAAEDAFDRAYKYGMRGPIFENDRGRLCLELGQLDEAVGHFESAIASLPSFMEARNNLAVAYRRAGELAKAEAALEEALRLDPDYAAGHFNLAEIYRERLATGTEADQDRWGRLAHEHYTQALLHGHDPELVIERRGGLALWVEDLETAEADLLRITEDPDIDARVLYLLGRVKKQQGELRIAATLYEMAISRGHADAEVFSDLGEVRLRQGDFESASQLLSQALERNPGLVVTRVNLCVVLVEMGDLVAANEILRQAEVLDPENELVQGQRDVLRQLGFEG